jgi:hypothetical protein
VTRAGPTIAIGAALAMLAGCVTEVVRPDATVDRRDPAGSLIDGPVAKPALNARTLETAVSVAVIPCGTIRYDVQVLPLVSPDGRFLATHQGRAPTWPTLLAQPDATIPIGTSLAIYDISDTTPEPIKPASDLPLALVLGRSADNQGFLVESPRQNGARWIGRVSWVTGELAWLVKDDYVNAHAFLSPDGTLAYARREIRADRFSLVVDGREVPASHDVSLEYPFATHEADLVYAMERSRQGVAVVAMRVGVGYTTTVARVRISTVSAPAAAYQAAAPAFVVPGDPGRSDRLVLFATRAQRMAVLDAVTGTLSPLPDLSIAAAPVNTGDRSGYFCTTPEGLVFTPRPDPTDSWDSDALPEPVAKILPDPVVPRATTDPERPFILLGPDPNRRERLRIHVLKPMS